MKRVKSIGIEWIAAATLAAHFLASAALAEAPLPPIAEGSEASEFDWSGIQA